MKLNEAIGATKEAVVFLKIHHQGRLAQGAELGIEALERIQHLRGYSMTQVDTRLSSETEE